MSYIAHISEDKRMQPLSDHAKNVASLCREFASQIGMPEIEKIGFVLGLLHDLGKASEAFQFYIKEKGLYGRSAPKAPHSIYGAEVAYHYCPNKGIGIILAYCISGHHRGLYNYWDIMNKLRPNTAKISSECKQLLNENPDLAKELKNELERLTLSLGRYDDIQLLVRMLFSCLVDADSLDTEAFCNPQQYASRQASATLVDKQLWKRLKKLLRERTDAFNQDGAINKARASFLSQCRDHGKVASKGIYSLSLPTGAGKTLSSMAWAIESAIKHEASRIIIVIPYTSIIVQTAELLKSIFGKDLVLEHHSEAKDPTDQEGYNNKNTSLKILAENWDAPIIITTNVQFFESLFSNKRAQCRKLHNICNSIIIFDEVQMFPTSFLHPMVRSIESLSRMFGTQTLLCTATQPIFNAPINNETFYTLEIKAQEVIPFDDNIFSIFNRVSYHIDETEIDIQTLVHSLSQHPSVLCVVNTRREALEIAKALKQILGENDLELIHLSRMMCSMHLKENILKIKERLSKGLPTKVISTQLIEAGVDLDFPVVYRASAGLDSIIQAAGRCNREGKRDQGQVYIFNLEGAYPPNELMRNQQATNLAIYDTQGRNIDHPDIIYSYFSHLYGRKANCDEKRIKDLLWDRTKCSRVNLRFEEACEKFKLIDDKQIDLYVPYCPNPEYSRLSGQALIASLKTKSTISTQEFKQLQQFRIGLKKQDFDKLYEQGIIEQVYLWGENNPPISVLTSERNYSKEFGILLANF